MEYQMENKNPRPPCFLLVLDTAMSAEELQDAKDSLGQLVALLPEECLVGLITFGATVTVHELCEHNAFPKSYVLRGTDDVTQEQLKKLLGLELSASEYASYDKQRGSAVAEASNALRRFILPVSECEFALQTALDELRPDPFPREQGTRPFRATGRGRRGGARFDRGVPQRAGRACDGVHVRAVYHRPGVHRGPGHVGDDANAPGL